jgi:PAS domain S-box-containing protein
MQLQTMNSAGGRLATAAATGIAIAFIFASIWLARDTTRVTEAGGLHASEATTAMFRSERLLSTLKDAETGQRGYLITGNAAYLAPYNAALARIDADLTDLKSASPINPETVREIERIRVLTITKLEELRSTVALGQSGQPEAAWTAVRTGRGKVLMDAIRFEVAAIGGREEAKPITAQAGNTSAFHWMAVAGTGVVASVLLAGVALTQNQARVQVATGLRRQERFAHAFGVTEGMMREFDSRIIFWGSGAERLYGFPPEEALDRFSHELLNTRFPLPLPEILVALRRDGYWQGELTRYCRDGTEIHVASQWTLHRGETGEGDTIIEICKDITEREHVEHRLRQMVDELNHRVKNTLSTVQTIARHTLRGVHPTYWHILEGRLFVLAAVHDALMREGLGGARLHELVTGGLAPCEGIGDERYLVSGPPLILHPRAALSLALGMHELATNAVKYGALSTMKGQVEIRWAISKGPLALLHLTWTERDGPPIVPPVRDGFGTWLVKRGMAQDLGGTVQLSFDDPRGVVCSIEVPLAGVVAPAELVPFPNVGRV